jgi:DNA-binding NtrC family response regulator
VRERLEQLVDEMVDKGILYEEAQREFERKYIARALHRAGGNLSRASAILGMHRNTLTRKLAAHRLKRGA